jgi:long-chain acyl-CoA synthetase
VYTIKEFLSYCADRYDSKTAFAYEQRRKPVSVSFADFRSDVDALGSYFFAQGYRDCHIAVFGENSYGWILTHFAVTCGKNVIVPIDKELDADSIATLLQDSESRVLVYSNTYADIVRELQQKLPGVTYINMKEIPSLVEQGKTLIDDDFADFLNVAVDKDDLASIVYTSGTTGKSKGVMLTHGNFMSNLYGASCNASISGTSILLLPLHHTFGLAAGLYSVMYYGFTLYINQSMKKILSDFQTAKPQNTFVVPLIVETLHKNIWLTAKKQGKDKALRCLIRISDLLRKVKMDLRKVLFKSVISAFGGNLDQIICGGAPLNPELVKSFDSLGITLLNGYGITECSPIVAVNRNQFNVVGSVGLPLCCNEVKISEDGEILVKGENVMVGYYHNEAENQTVFVDGWFRTGDLGRIDEYGALHITGRIKNLIILSNGENISAESIEQLVCTIPYVKEVIAYGEDDVIVAEVFLDEEVTDAKERIHGDINTLNQKLPYVKNIGKVVIRDTEFPKTTTKKIKRNYGG